MSRRIIVVALLAVLAAGLGASVLWGGAGPRATATAAAPIAVRVSQAVRKNVPIFLEGLGSVQASKSVTVRTRVDGALTEVTFREGQDVRAGDVLARIDPRTFRAALDEALARKRQDEATLANARLDLVRYRSLAASKSGSVQRSDTAAATVAQLEAQVAQDLAAVSKAAVELSYTTITAPIAGRTGLLQVDAGNIIHPTDPNGIVLIGALQPIAVLFTLPRQSLLLIQRAMEAGPTKVAVLQSGSATPDPETGWITVLDNQVDQSSGTIKLKAVFANEQGNLWPGAFVVARVLVQTQQCAVTVSPLAIQRGPQGPYVFAVRDARTVERRAVRIAHQDKDVVIVAEGVQPGDLLVTVGASRLEDGSAVTIVDPPGAPTIADGPSQPGKS